MKTIDLHQVDAFTDTIFGGNPAGVVTNADGLSDEEMAKLAREMNLSETAFVSKATTPEADFRLRWFTPTAEVDFCGHATIGTLYELARLKQHGLGEDGRHQVRVETKSGILKMWSTVQAGRITATFTTPVPQMAEYRLQGEAFASTLGIPPEALLPGAKIMINTPLNDIIIPVTSPQALGRLTFDFARIRKHFAAEGIVVFGLFAVNKAGEFEVRGLAPLVGIDEDPFTGRLQAELIAAAKHNSLIAPEQNEIISRQGHFMGRPGQARVSIDASGATKVAAGAAHVFSTTIIMPS